MKSGGALLLIVVGLVVLWIVVTGRLGAFQTAWSTLTTGAAPASSAAPSGTTSPTAGAGSGASAIGGVNVANSAQPGQFTPALPVPTFPVAHSAVAPS